MYKTIVLQLLAQRPEMYSRLRKSRQMLATLEAHARNLKDRHELWKEQLAQARPGSDPTQIANEALEIALKELENHLSCASAPDDSEPVILDAAMAFITRPTPPA